MVGKYPGLDKAVDEVLVSHVPLENVALTKEVAGKLIVGCREVEKQCE